MAATHNPRQVRCYHCGRLIEVSAKAQSASCPHCHKSLNTADVVIKDTKRGVRVDSCGKVSIKARARVVTKRLHAMEGLEMLGKLQADVECRGTVVIGPKAEWKGDLRAAGLEVAKGAKIEHGYFDIRPFDEDEAPIEASENANRDTGANPSSLAEPKPAPTTKKRTTKRPIAKTSAAKKVGKKATKKKPPPDGESTNPGSSGAKPTDPEPESPE